MWALGDRERRADRGPPHAEREREEEEREREVRQLPLPAEDDDDEQQRRTDDQEEREDREQQLQAQMTLCSFARWPSAKRARRSGAMSSDGRFPTTTSATISPIAGACMRPWPEKPAATTNPAMPSTAPTMGCLSGVSS